MSRAMLFTDDDTWKVEGDLSFETAPELFESARNAMSETVPSCIDFADVERVESAGVALMLDWIRMARAHGQTLVFSNVPDHLTSIAELCGVAHLVAKQ